MGRKGRAVGVGRVGKGSAGRGRGKGNNWDTMKKGEVCGRWQVAGRHGDRKGEGEKRQVPVLSQPHPQCVCACTRQGRLHIQVCFCSQACVQGSRNVC